MLVTLIHVWLWLTKTATCQQLTAMRRRLRRRTEGPSAEGSSQARWQCTRLTPRPDSWGWVAHTLPGSRPHQCRRYSRNALCLTARIIQQKHNMTEHTTCGRTVLTKVFCCSFCPRNCWINYVIMIQFHEHRKTCCTIHKEYRMLFCTEITLLLATCFCMVTSSSVLQVQTSRTLLEVTIRVNPKLNLSYSKVVPKILCKSDPCDNTQTHIQMLLLIFTKEQNTCWTYHMPAHA